MTINVILFISLAAIAIVSALGLLLNRNAVYAALFLILNFATVAVLYLLLQAPFIAIVQITVYAGAIMVLFLFVIMLLGAEQIGRKPAARWMRPVAGILGGALAVETLYIFLTQPFQSAVQTSAEFGSPAQVGMALFSDYLLPFEITSVLLLAAMVGAIVLTKREKRKA